MRKINFQMLQMFVFSTQVKINTLLEQYSETDQLSSWTNSPSVLTVRAANSSSWIGVTIVICLHDTARVRIWQSATDINHTSNPCHSVIVWLVSHSYMLWVHKMTLKMHKNRWLWARPCWGSLRHSQTPSWHLPHDPPNLCMAPLNFHSGAGADYTVMSDKHYIHYQPTSNVRHVRVSYNIQ